MSEDSITVMLQPEDDTETILEKVRVANAQQISLIVPPGTKALQTLGGFTMLRKACDITGIVVTVYSDDEKTCDMAKVCRFDVVRLDAEMPPRVLPEEEEAPRIVVSTRPPEPTGVVEAERSPELEHRLEGLSEADLALFDALESMSLEEDIELGAEAFARPAPAAAPVVREEAPTPPRAERERRPRKPSPLRHILDPFTSALGNLYIAVVGGVLSIAARFQARQEAAAREEAPAAVGPRVRSEEEVRTRRTRLQRYYLWTLLGVVGLTIFILLVHLLSLPKATVALFPREAEAKEMDLSLTITLDGDVEGGKATIDESGTVTIPAKAVQVEMEGQASAPATGETWIAEGTATGAVIFTNRTEYAINVPGGTRISGAGATFHTTQDIVVPASDFWGSDAYVGIAQVGISADEPGSAGNVDAWTLSTISGDLAGLLNVINETPTSGGSERKGTIVTAEDQEALRQQLVVELQEEAYAELEKQLASLEVLEGTLEIETIEEHFDHQVNDEAGTVVLTARVRASALASAPGLLDQALHDAISSEISETKTGQEIDFANVSHEDIKAVAPVQGINAWTYSTHVRVPIVNTIDKDLRTEIQKRLRGRTLEEALSIMQEYQDRISDFAINPAMDRLPRYSSRIQVVDVKNLADR